MMSWLKVRENFWLSEIWPATMTALYNLALKTMFFNLKARSKNMNKILHRFIKTVLVKFKMDLIV